MSNKRFRIAIMAAGKGTRMKSDKAKVLHTLTGRSLIMHVLVTSFSIEPEHVYVIIGHQGNTVKDHVLASQDDIPKDKITWVEQKEQLGTGHAIMQLQPHLSDFDGDLLILNGDLPLLSSSTLENLKDHHDQAHLDGTLLSMALNNPTGYGRILRKNRVFTGIVEHKDASEEQRNIQEVNAGVYIFDWSSLSPILDRLQNNNAQNEYYLPDVIPHYIHDHQRVDALCLADPTEMMGINNRLELARLETAMRQRINNALMESGVTIRDSQSTYIDCTVKVEPDCEILPGTLLKGYTTIASGCQIGPHSQLTNVQVGRNCNITFSVLIDAEVGESVNIGPYAHIRPQAKLENNSKVGNFVELKKTTLGEGAKANHLAYLGDATIGKKANIGAGTITCNYDGKNKFRTEIGERTFVGSNSTLVAPLTLEDDAYVAAGSTITDHVSEGTLAIGRGRQANKEGWVYKKRESWQRT